jgi:hypothetical protein
MTKKFSSFKAFYPFYLNEHQNRNCRRLHFLGSMLVIIVLLASLLTKTWLLLATLPLIGYGFAWLGHLVFEKNKPATFSYPFYSFIGDWQMFLDILRGRVKL